MSILLIILTLELTILLLFLAFLSWYLRGKAIEIMSFIIASKESEASPLAILTDSLLDTFADKICNKVKSVFMGVQSGQSRLDKAIEGDMAFDSLTSQSPLLDALVSSFPSLAKRIRKNPALAQYALQKLSQLQGKQSTLPLVTDNHKINFD